MTTTEPAAHLISVIAGGVKYPGEKIITIICPFCQGTHKHRGEALNIRQARCDATKSYLITRWRQP